MLSFVLVLARALVMPGEVRALADGNLDGGVDVADHTIWADKYRSTGVGIPVDYNGNRLVDLSDCTLWANDYGLGIPNAPIPSTFVTGALDEDFPASLGRWSISR
jgi:hypothetical protein